MVELWQRRPGNPPERFDSTFIQLARGMERGPAGLGPSLPASDRSTNSTPSSCIRIGFANGLSSACGASLKTRMRSGAWLSSPPCATDPRRRPTGLAFSSSRLLPIPGHWPTAPWYCWRTGNQPGPISCSPPPLTSYAGNPCFRLWRISQGWCPAAFCALAPCNTPFPWPSRTSSNS